MSNQCPRCQSFHLAPRELAKKTGGVIGAAGGGIAGTLGAMSGAEAGAALGAVVGPLGFAVGGLAGAIFGGLLGSAACCVAGSQVGEMVDEKVLGNCECLDCGFVFSAPAPKETPRQE